MGLELKHHYGNQYHILDDIYLNSLLTQVCVPESKQPTLNSLVEILYANLLRNVLTTEFRQEKISVATRMTAKHPEQKLHTSVIAREQKVVSVNLARAGTFPSHICYNLLNYLLNPDGVRQDHIIAARQTDSKQHVTGTSLTGSKIGGGVDDMLVLFPDPMGATGSTISAVVDFYKKNVEGKAKKFVAMNLIVTPEYLARLKKDHPDMSVFAIRLDRGLSPASVLKEVPGLKWTEEKGLDDTDYIVPGGGGVGEILNNAYV